MIEKNWKEIIKPSKLQVKNDVDNQNTSTIIAEFFMKVEIVLVYGPM
jgi:hypothetical protein